MHQLPAEGGIDIARGLHDQLKKLGYSVFIDHEGLRAGAFNHALYQEIENCDVFLLVLSKDSLDRCRHTNDWVRQELAHAIRCRKNIVPVMKEGFRFPANLPDDIEQIRFCQALRISYDFYDAFLKKLEENGVETLYRAEADPAAHSVGDLKVIVEEVLAHNRVAITADHIYYWVRDKGLFRCGP